MDSDKAQLAGTAAEAGGEASSAQRLAAERTQPGTQSSTAASCPVPPATGIVAEESAAGIVLCRRYRLQEQLGAGAMGTVYRALDLKLDRQVAIKLLPERSVTDSEAVARFQREARALAKLSHPHIVQAHDADEDSGCHFLVMELVVGQTLAAVLRQQGPLSPGRAATFGWQAALGLAHAHERGLVHRDLKPSNLLRTADGNVKILDLGLARFLQDQIGDATLTTEGLGMGTPDYMAPEQFQNARNADARSDIYSLGCTLYHLIAGRVPFPTSSLAEKYAAHEHQPATPLEELCPDVPAGLALTIGKMMAKRPDERHASALHAAEALVPYVAGSSQAIAGIQATGSWHGNQAGQSARTNHKRPRQIWIAGLAGGSIALVGLLLLAGWYGGLFGGPKEMPSSGPAAPATNRVAPVPQTPADPNVLTVAQNGTGQYRTASDALEHVTHPNMTILFRDAGHYDDALFIANPAQQAGLKIESPHGATLQVKPDNSLSSKALLHIRGVEGVRVSGLRFKVQTADAIAVLVSGQSPGVVLEDLQLDVGRNLKQTAGVSIEAMVLKPEHAPVVVQRCNFRGGFCGVQITGKVFNTTNITPVAGVVVQDCSMSNCQVGVVVAGQANRVLVCGNRIWACDLAGITFFEVAAGSGQLAVLNNTILGPQCCISVVNTPQEIPNLELVNNLLIATAGPELNLENSACNPNNWRKHHNWRQLPPSAEPAVAAAGDRVAPADTGLSLNSSDADFLRPKVNSPLATAGAGGELPAFIGAVPPVGVQDWDWQKTWDSQDSASQNAKKEQP